MSRSRAWSGNESLIHRPKTPCSMETYLYDSCDAHIESAHYKTREYAQPHSKGSNVLVGD